MRLGLFPPTNIFFEIILFSYGYNSFEREGTTWCLTTPREYLVVTQDLVISRAVVEQVQQRFVLQQVKFFSPCPDKFLFLKQVNFQSEASILGICRKQLKKAVFLDWLMRHHREVLGWHVMEMHDGMVMAAINHVRHNGLPSCLHSCSAAGTEHIATTIQQQKWAEGDIPNY